MPFGNYLWWCKDELDAFFILKELGDEWYFYYKWLTNKWNIMNQNKIIVTLLYLQFPHCQYCPQILFLEITIQFDISTVSINKSYLYLQKKKQTRGRKTS